MRTLPCTTKSAVGIVLHHRPERRGVRLHLLRQRYVAVFRRDGHRRDLHLRDAVVQAVRVSVLDAGEQLGDLRRRVARGLVQHVRGGRGPDLGGHRRALGVALVLTLRVQHPEHRHHSRATLFGGGHQLPVARARPIGNRRHLLGLQSGRQGAGEPAAGGVGQQRVARRRHRQAWGRWLREQPGGGAGVAEERLRQVAARREQQQDKQAEA
jgi:hypothetical protein